MTTVSLRTLVRQPIKIKRLTRAGKSVQVTDNGQPLWIIQPASAREDLERRREEIEAEFAGVLRSPRAQIPLSQIILQSRR